jgi:hypothetical protein
VRLALLLVLVLPGAASAATVRVGAGGDVIYLGGAGQADTVTVGTGGERVTFAGPGIEAGEGCAAEGERVSCPAPRFTIRVRLGAGDDALAVVVDGPAPFPLEVHGGPGADRIATAGERDRVDGGPGDDTIATGAGPDTVLERTGDSDTLDGGAGDDLVDYTRAAAPVRIDLATGEGPGDALAGFEDASGGRYADLLIGDDGDNDLAGGAGGPDSILGRGGHDSLAGSPQADRLDGGAGPDSIAGAGGRDDLRGGPGDDIFQSGADVPPRVTCGPGRDYVALVGGPMAVAADCDLLYTHLTTFGLKVAGGRVTLRSRRVSCLSVRIRGGAPVAVPRGRGGTVTLPLPPRGRALVSGRWDCGGPGERFVPLFYVR